MFSRRSTHPASVLDECRAALQNSRKRPMNDTTFGDVFFEHFLSKRGVRRRRSDSRYELVTRGRLQIVTRKELQEICYEDARRLFDPAGMLWHHSTFLKKIPGLAVRYNLPCWEVFDGDVLESRRKLLPPTPSEWCSKTLLRLPLPHLVPFLEKERPLRATCRALRDTIPWNPKPCLPRELLRAWEHLRSGDADVHNVTSYATARLHDVLFGQLRLRRLLDKRSLARAAKFVAAQLDLKPSRGVGGTSWNLVVSFGAFKGWITAFDESGAFILAQDSYDGWSLSELRKASESLRCVGVRAEVLGPLNYPRRSDASSLMEKNPSYAFAHGYCLRRGEIWALRVSQPLTGW